LKITLHLSFEKQPFIKHSTFCKHFLCKQACIDFEYLKENNILILGSLVEKWTSIPVPEAFLYQKSYRYKRFGTKAPLPPFGTGSLQTGIKGASTLASRRAQG
jgi:hypothetical protein